MKRFLKLPVSYETGNNFLQQMFLYLSPVLHQHSDILTMILYELLPL
jgi:hypothetical protein